MAPRRSARQNSARVRSDALWDLLRDCHRGIRGELRDVVGRRGLYLSEYRALGALRDGPRTPSEIAERLGLTPAAMTDLSTQLLARAWVSRRPHPSDGRSHLLRATPAGAAVYARARREYRTRLATVYGALTARDRRALGDGLSRLAVVLDGLRSAVPPRPKRARSTTFPGVLARSRNGGAAS